VLIVVRRLYVSLVEPPTCHNITVLIGRNSRGQWVARQQSGLYGGLFVSRAAAVRYALFENGHHPEAIISSASPIELDMSATPSGPDQLGASATDTLPPPRRLIKQSLRVEDNRHGAYKSFNQVAGGHDRRFADTVR
jgi:hypothetical protein